MSAEFKAAIQDWKKRAIGDLQEIGRRSIFEISRMVVDATPVDTGFLRGNWQPSLNQVSGGYSVVAIRSDGLVVANLGFLLESLDVGDTFFMVNNTVYAKRLEYGFVGEDALGRNFSQSGRFYVKDTVSKWQSVVAKVAAEVRAGD